MTGPWNLTWRCPCELLCSRAFLFIVLRSAQHPQIPRFLQIFRGIWPMPLSLLNHSALALFAQRTRIPTSARSIGFCAIWVCISSSSSSISGLENPSLGGSTTKKNSAEQRATACIRTTNGSSGGLAQRLLPSSQTLILIIQACFQSYDCLNLWTYQSLSGTSIGAPSLITDVTWLKHRRQFPSGRLRKLVVWKF